MRRPSDRRRQFLKKSAALTGALALPWSLQGCGSSDGGTAVPTIAKVDVLADGPAGELSRAWNGFQQVTLRRGNRTELTYGGDPQTLNAPRSAATAPDGSIWIADSGNDRLLQLDASLNRIGAVTAVAGRPFARPTGVAALPDGRFAACDQILGQVALFDPATGSGMWMGISADEHVKTGWRPHWDTETDPRILEDPKFVCAVPSGGLAVLDVTANRMVFFTTAGVAVEAVRLAGRPTGFAFAPDGACYVCDRVSRTVQRIDPNSRAVETVLDRAQADEIGGIPYHAVWRSRSTALLSNLIVSFWIV